MKHLIPKTMTAVPVLALALAVGGCGSSSDDDGGMPMEPTADEIRAEKMMACTDAGGRFNADDTCTTAAELAEEARMAGELAGRQAQCEADDGRWNSDNTCTSAAELLVEAEMACEAGNGRWNDDDTCTDAAGLMVEAAARAADTKAEAITTEAGQGPGQTPANPDAGLGGSDHVNADTTPGNADDPYTLEIERDRDGTMIKITDHGMTGDDDPKFMQAMDLGGGTTMHVRTMKADDDGNVMEEVVMVTTDIEAPKATPFAMVTGQMLNARDLDAGTDTDGDGTPTNDFTALTIADSALVMSSAFDTATAAVLTFDADVTTTTGTDEAFETAGTYNGAMGTYRCDSAGTDCTVTITIDDNDMAMISAMTGWVFIPDDGATSDVADADYLHYGFWLKKTTDADDETTYNEVETIAGSSITASEAVDAVTGTASYDGGATGVYVHNVVNSDGSRDSSTSGSFTADASLMATFGQVEVDGTGTIAPNMLNTITGTIDNFMLSGGEANTWSVALSGDITTASGTASGMAKGGVGDGSFSATFHGPVAAVDGVVPHPHSVVGEFNAGFTNGSVAGGFGARMQDDE